MKRWPPGWPLQHAEAPRARAPPAACRADALVIQTLTAGMSVGRLQWQPTRVYIGFTGKPPVPNHQDCPMQPLRRNTNPFALMLDPQAVLAQIASSGRLERLERRVCRPLDKPLLGGADMADGADEAAGATAEADGDGLPPVHGATHHAD